MIITCWVLFAFFAPITISGFLTLWKRATTYTEIIAYFISAFISAITAGVLFGGLQIF